LAEVSDTAPALGAGVDGSLELSWVRTPDEGDDAALQVSFGPGSWSPDGAPVEVDSGEVTGGPSVGGPYLAWHREGAAGYSIHVRPLEGGGELEFGDDGAFDHTPAVAQGGDGGAVTWLQVDSGIRNDLWMAPFHDHGDGLDAGGPRQVETDGAVGPYAPDLVHLTGDVWFAVWAEGDSPDFRLFGRFLDLEE
jgi:hypothetical protein